jgi:hypothetical protein
MPSEPSDSKPAGGGQTPPPPQPPPPPAQIPSASQVPDKHNDGIDFSPLNTAISQLRPAKK